MSERIPRGLGPEPSDQTVIVRGEAPDHLRKYVQFLLEHFNVSFGTATRLMAAVFESPVHDFIDSRKRREDAIQHALAICEWEEIYLLIQVIYDHVLGLDNLLRDEEGAERYNCMVNEYFRRHGIGYQLVDGRIQHRGDEPFEKAARSALKAAEESGLNAAHRELLEALDDLGKRPEPDLTGAISHSMASWLCVARAIDGDENANPGEILRRNPDLVPKPLDDVVKKLWGYSSQHGRKVSEGKTPTYDEAELVVALSAGAVTYLVRKSGLIDGDTP